MCYVGNVEFFSSGESISEDVYYVFMRSLADLQTRLSDVHSLGLFIANIYSSFNGELSEECRGLGSNSRQILHHFWLATGLHTGLSKISFSLFYSVGYSSRGGQGKLLLALMFCISQSVICLFQRLDIIFDTILFCKVMLSVRESDRASLMLLLIHCMYFCEAMKYFGHMKTANFQIVANI